MKKILIVLLFLPIYAIANEDCGKSDNCNYPSMWGGFSKFTVNYAKSKGEKGSNFVYISSDREGLMTFETKIGTANIFSIPGVATLWSGIGKTGIKTSLSCYKDVRDTFAIIQSYAVRALFFIGFSIKGGPELVSDTVNIDVGNKEDTRVQINPGDHMIIGGPWSLKGFVKRDDKITFEISHKFLAKGNSVSLFLTGTWQDDPVVIPIENTQSLNDWLVCLSGKQSYENGKSKFTPIIDDTSNLKTIGDLRSLTKRYRRSRTPRKL